MAPGRRLLVVDDDPAIVVVLAAVLEHAGFDVTTALSATEATPLLREAWDAIIVDINLAGASGFDLVGVARDLHPHLPIALMTGDASVEVAVRALRSDVDEFLTKPIDPAALVEQVEQLVARRGTRGGRQPQRVLAVGAHPDDVEIGVGGILLGHRAAGDAVAICTMSHGTVGGDRDARAAEARAAADLVGATLFLFDLDDTHVSESNPTVGLLEAVIGEFRPTIVYTHSVNDLHQDHRNVHRATAVAARTVPTVCCYESPSTTVDFRPTRFVSIEPHLEAKLEVIDAYGSQVAIRSYLEPDLIRATGRYWGRFGGNRASEPLEVLRDRTGLVPGEQVLRA